MCVTLVLHWMSTRPSDRCSEHLGILIAPLGSRPCYQRVSEEGMRELS